MTYGVPYLGSKNAIASEIIDILPRGRNFYDLFAGGCALTHAAMLSGKYNGFVVNDVYPLGIDLFGQALFSRMPMISHFVNREEFYEKRQKDPFVSLVWSFGSNTNDYIYAKDIEPQKKDGHDTLFTRYHCDYAEYRKCGGIRLQHVERYNRLKEIESLARFKDSFCATYQDYMNVLFSEDDVVVCDIPYKGSVVRAYHQAQKTKFDYERFYDWVRYQRQPIFICEYEMPSDFVSIWSKSKSVTAHGDGGKRHAVENVFVHEKFADAFVKTVQSRNAQCELFT